jgi:hypothetical protein
MIDQHVRQFLEGRKALPAKLQGPTLQVAQLKSAGQLLASAEC